MYQKEEGNIVGVTLVVLKDSTYYMQTCGGHLMGRWRIRAQDTLLLFCERIRLRNDSLNRIEKPTCGTEPSKYLIKGNELISSFIYEGELVHYDLIKRKF